MTFVLPEWECLRAALPRWVLLYDLMCSYHPLPLCQSRSGVAESPSTGTLLNAASASNAAFGTQSAAKQSSLAPHDSKARLQNGYESQGFMAKPCTPHPIAQRVQPFKLQTRNANFLWEGVREGYLFLKKRYPSLIRIPCAAQGMDAALPRCQFRFPYGKTISPEAKSCRGRREHENADAARSVPPARRCWTRRGSSQCPSPW